MEIKAPGEDSPLRRVKGAALVEGEKTNPEPLGPQGEPLYPRAEPQNRRVAARPPGPRSIPRGPEAQAFGVRSTGSRGPSDAGFRVSVGTRCAGWTELAQLTLAPSKIEKMCSIFPSPRPWIGIQARPAGTVVPLMPPRLRYPFRTSPEVPVYFLLDCFERRNQTGTCLERGEARLPASTPRFVGGCSDVDGSEGLLS